MSKSVAEVLRLYHELEGSEPGSQLQQIKMDIDRAIENAPLTIEEWALLVALFFTEPEAPERDRTNRAGGTSGRPPGGTTQAWVAAFLFPEKSENARNVEVSRRLRHAYDTLGEYLGPDYFEQA